MNAKRKSKILLLKPIKTLVREIELGELDSRNFLDKGLKELKKRYREVNGEIMTDSTFGTYSSRFSEVFNFIKENKFVKEDEIYFYEQKYESLFKNFQIQQKKQEEIEKRKSLLKKRLETGPYFREVYGSCFKEIIDTRGILTDEI